jgi:aminopeptidase N
VLAALVDAHAALAEPALARFHELFRGDALVIDKWFMLQARAPESEGRVFERVRALLKHPDFSMHNPNRVRSLVFTLCNANPAAFHRPDGAGYGVWADVVLALNSSNPKMAARLARSLDRWASLAEPCRGAAQAAIERVAAHAELSPDVREIVARALEAG